MPTPEEIKKIAHEYGVLMAKDIPESNCLKNEVISSTEDYLVQFMSWLCKDFCIVPKSKVQEVYANHIDNIKSSCFEYLAPQVENYMQACYRSALQNLFGKSLFEEEK